MSQKPTLLILAAGMASRYGSLKQMDAFGANGETIIDYSIYDAIKAGFGKVVFIIRKDLEADFKAFFEPKLQGKIATDYVFQTFDLVPFGITQDIAREKPWGTAHAILSARETIKEPFCVINADDFYGRDSFLKMANFLTTEVADDNFSLMGYEIANTLSEHGSVSRGVCKVSNTGFLESIIERTKVYAKNGLSVYEEKDVINPLDKEAKASMNFWGFTPSIFGITQRMFKKFALENASNPKSEFFIPLLADELIQSQNAKFKVIPTDSHWFGVTYKEDKSIVQKSISDLVKKGIYPDQLWS